SQTEFASFEEFWPFYVGEHKLPLNRALHYAGTTMACSTVCAAVLTFNPLWLLATPIVGYGPAWVGHFILEKNRPATFKHPIYSLRGDFRMLKYALQGKMAKEVERLYGPLASNGHAPGAAKNGSQSEPSSTDGAATNGSSHENGAVVGSAL
ncbi:MAG: Mpo1-like protein, partial [Polyangiaceae bacterium]